MKDKRIRIRVAIPLYNAISNECVNGLKQLKAYNETDGKYFFDIKYKFGALISGNRHECVTNSAKQRQTLDKRIAGYLFVDSDIGFTLDHAISLIESGKDIISGCYPKRSHQDKYNAGMWNNGNKGIIGEFFGIGDTGIKECEWVGGGFLYVKKEALESMLYPWFRNYIVEIDDEAAECGEDLGFCINAQKAGLKIYAHCDVVLQHIEEVGAKHREVLRIYADENGLNHKLKLFNLQDISVAELFYYLDSFKTNWFIGAMYGNK